jgi:hypothetical protein
MRGTNDGFVKLALVERWPALAEFDPFHLLES